MLFAITKSDLELAFTSCRQFTRHFGIGISRFAALDFRTVEISAFPCGVRHARRTEIWGVGSSRKTQSHCRARIRSEERRVGKECYS